MRVEVIGKSDVGLVREENEDTFLVREDLGLYMVADGMGGHVGGKMASNLTVETFAELIERNFNELRENSASAPAESSPIPRILSVAVQDVCSRVFEKSVAEPELSGMGTTLTAMLVLGDRGYFAQVGDSRAYLLRGQELVQVTDDHSLVNEQVKAGLITESQAKVSRLRNIITRSVGFEKDVSVDIFSLPLCSGDKFFLCSDGLSNVVGAAEIGGALLGYDLEAVPDRMIDLANHRGGDDNITVVCVRVV
ncbi:MAG: protein phosphatase [Myxococcales bacterium]|nr:protein phosphatase [Myxococcales bacterium]